MGGRANTVPPRFHSGSRATLRVNGVALDPKMSGSPSHSKATFTLLLRRRTYASVVARPRPSRHRRFFRDAPAMPVPQERRQGSAVRYAAAGGNTLMVLAGSCSRRVLIGTSFRAAGMLARGRIA